MRDFIVREDKLSEKERRNLNILDAIRRSGEISRAEISKTTDLTIVTVPNYSTKYVNKKLVFETGLDISSGGRRPELLKLNPEYKYSVGIDLGAPHLTVNSEIIGAILDVNGKVVAKEKIKVRTSYNVAAVSFTPKDIFEEIKKHIPEFTIEYNPDERQAISDSWPNSIDDSAARKDWGWDHEYGLEEMTKKMLEELKKKLG